jgi:hypothetical protein
LYLPPEALLQLLAAVWKDPEGSGKTYQLRVGVPPLEDPHAASPQAVNTEMAHKASLRPSRRSLGASLLSTAPLPHAEPSPAFELPRTVRTTSGDSV